MQEIQDVILFLVGIHINKTQPYRQHLQLILTSSHIYLFTITIADVVITVADPRGWMGQLHSLNPWFILNILKF